MPTLARMPRHRTPRLLMLAALALLLAGCGRPAHGIQARQVRQDGLTYRVVSIDLQRRPLGLYWRNPETRRPFASIPALQRWGRAHDQKLLFAANAGIYDHRGAPLGLYVEGGRTLVPLNTAHGDPSAGNFSIQPNGVFSIDRQGQASVMSTADFRARQPQVRWATQSGPMLVVDGKLNDSFRADSSSLKWRSGVCAPNPYTVVFAVSEGPVNFHSFARLFADTLGCRNALYLDGSISQFYVDGEYYGAPDFLVKPYAGMFAVFADH